MLYIYISKWTHIIWYSYPFVLLSVSTSWPIDTGLQGWRVHRGLGDPRLVGPIVYVQSG